jgi:GT2 family glycosyltransferase
MFCEEIDWSWRVRQAGWEIYTVPAAEIVHYAGESTSQVPATTIVNLWRSRERLYRKHHGRLHHAVAARLVHRTMTRKAGKAADPEMRRAYQEVATIWSANGTK